jgi:hypothetical protein
MGDAMIGRIYAAVTGLVLGLAAPAAEAATRPPAQKAAPACGALRFRPLPSGMSDGEQQAGMYRSRFARIELRADIKQGVPTDYFVTSGGKRIATAAATLPDAAVSCAAAKKMPAPGTPASSCTGQSFTVVLVHNGNERLALLYALDGSAWRFCNAGSF